MVDTKTVARRELSFANLDAVVADAERLVASDAGTVGNWSLGQILEHVATVMEKSIDGFEIRPPLIMRLLGRWVLKKRFLKNGMPAGFQLQGPAAKELLPAEVPPQQALERLRHAAERLKNETQRATHPFFGNLNQDESNRINCRHAELHMSFIKDEG